jgi:signal transduction histidine kinase
MRERYVTADERDQLLRRLTPASPMQTHEVAMLTTDQQLLRVQESVVAMFDGAGSLTRLHGFLLDVTERRLAEAALEQRDAELRQSQKMEAIGRLAGGIAHDFNNLLTAIIGFSELASAETSVPRIHEHLSEIRKATHSASALTRQLLAFSRKQPLAPEIVDLNGVIQRLDKLLRRTIGEDLELRYQLCGRSPAVRVDPGQLEQVLINLTVNARDAMPDGGTLTISTRCFGTRVLLAVSDTGHGIPQDVLPHIFEPFFTTKEQGKGTGLGLATVYGIVTRLGGVIRAKNNPAGGATFTIGLSVVGEHAAEGVEPATSDAQRGSETILLVEDEPSVRVLAERLLTRHGYRVLSATDVEEAVAIAEERSGEIDLLLTDVIMPRLSGPDLAASLTSMLPQLKVLYMSGYADHPRLRSDTTIVVAKPFTSAVLTSAVRAALDATSATIEPVP